METITETGLVQPRESAPPSCPRPKRFKLRNNEAWDRLKLPSLALIRQFPGIQPSGICALLNTDGHWDWLPRGANAHGVVARVLRRLEKASLIVQAGGWFLAEEATKDGIASHSNQVARRGMKVATNAVGKARSHGALGDVPRKTKKAVQAIEEIFP